MEHLNKADKFIPKDLPDRSPKYVDEYCSKHPYFERSVRQIVSKYRYIPFSEVLDTIDFLVNNEFRDIALSKLEQGEKYIFTYDYEDKSGFYFSLLFLKYLSNSIPVQYWSQISICRGSKLGEPRDRDPKNNYVMVDDGSYSGDQLTRFIRERTLKHATIILVAASQLVVEKLNKYKTYKTFDIKFMIGIVDHNPFKFNMDEFFRDTEILYESDGIIHCLFGNIDGFGDATSGFYFQHKYPDYISIPLFLDMLPDPVSVNRVLTLKEKYDAIGNPEPPITDRYTHALPRIDDVPKYPLIICDNTKMQSVYTTCFEAFYKDPYYSNVLGDPNDLY